MFAAKPPTLEFAGSMGGTFPLWYDPADWYAGVTAHFQLMSQLRVFRTSLRQLFDYWFVANPLIPTALLGLWASRQRARHRSSPTSAPMTTLVLWSFMAIALYAAVNPEPRLVAPFVLLLVLWAFVAAGGPGAAGGTRRTRAAQVVATILAGYVCIVAASDVNHLARQVIHAGEPSYLEAATNLRRSGLGPGASLAVIDMNSGRFDFTFAYAAHAAHDSVVAQIPSPESFPELTDLEVEQLASRLAEIRVAAIIAWHADQRLLPGKGWRFVTLGDGSRFGILQTGR